MCGMRMVVNAMGSAKSLIIGAGEIGQSLCAVLKDSYEVHIRDIENPRFEFQFSVLHICYPYSDRFVEITKNYIKQYNPSLTCIHSTVKPGTTRQFGLRVVHSPVLGRHPHLEKSLRTFTKFVGAIDRSDAEDALLYFELAGVDAEIMYSPETTELAKILCTTNYGMQIVIEKEIHQLCETYGVPFNQVYTRWTENYNNGYIALGDAQFVRPVLDHMPGPISGHCILPNCELIDTWLTRIVKERNEKY